VNLRTAAISRDRDERCTPSLVWSELKGSLRYPAQIAAVLSGYSSELVAQTAGGLTYVSTERILAEHIRSHVDTPALGVTRVGTLLMFYGHGRLGLVLRSELDVLHAYDQMLESESQRDADFAMLVRSR